MTRHHLALAVALAAASMVSNTLRAEIDFTPIPSSYVVDGVTMSRVIFRDGSQEVAYKPPQDWRLSGSGPKLPLVPNAFTNTNARVEVKTVVNPPSIDQANLPKYVASAQQSLPRGAKNAEVIESKLNPLRICGLDTLAVDLKYEAFGATYRSQLLYLNRSHEQWVFQFTAPAGGFERAFEPFRVSLYSLMGL